MTTYIIKQSIDGIHEFSISADSYIRDNGFFIFKRGKELLLLAEDTIIAISTEKFLNVKTAENTPISRKEHNDKIIKLYNLGK